MGRVYEAEDLELGRRCALKVLLPELHTHAEAVERFVREATWAAGLDHPNVVRVFDRGRLDDGSPFFTMELLHGQDLAELITRKRRLPWGRARHIILQLCAVLERAHARGIVHRDLKPENCFLVEIGGDPDFLKLLDFGIARQETTADARLTTTGFVLGTALYMSPQQARGEKADHRADVYAVGVLLYEMLSGVNPFACGNALQVLSAIQSDPVKPLTEFGLPPAIDALVGRAMHRDLDARFPSAEALRHALLALESDAVATAPVTSTRPYNVSPPPGPSLQATRLAVADPAHPYDEATAKTLYSVPLPSGPPRPRHRALLVAPALAAVVAILAAFYALTGGPEPAADVEPTIRVEAPLGEPAEAADVVTDNAGSTTTSPSPAPSPSPTASAGAEGALSTAEAAPDDDGDDATDGNPDSAGDLEAQPESDAKGRDGDATHKPATAPSPLTRAKVRAWAQRQENKPPARCSDLSRGYGATFRFTVITERRRASLKRIDGGNTGARCAQELVASFARWATRYGAPSDAQIEAVVRYGR